MKWIKGKINPSLINTCEIDLILPNHDSTLVKTLIDQVDYGEMPNKELEVLCKIVKKVQPETIFEIGTFMGRTTLQLASNSVAQICTLDLPPKSHNDYAAPVVDDPELDVYPQQPGIKFQNTQYAERIQQLYGNSHNFDFSSFYGQIDCVFVDANHHYEFVLRDSMNAFKMIKPDGVIIWHDCAPYAPGVIRALDLVSQKFPLSHIQGTSLAIYMGEQDDHKNKMEKKDSSQSSSPKFSDDSKLIYAKTEQMIKSGNIDEAKQILFKLIENSPDDMTALTHLAMIEYGERNFQSAKEFIKGALIIDPSNDSAKSVLKNIQKSFVSF